MIPVLIFKFFCYSVAGWLFETVYCFIIERKFVYRGFLNGPYCPIYGFGALAIEGIFSFIKISPVLDVILIFLIGFVLCSAIEYLGALILEKLFGLKLWDYSNFPLNLHGRIWIGFSVWWGAACVLVVMLIDPLFDMLIQSINPELLTVLSVIVAIIFIVDAVFTVLDINAVKKGLEQLKDLAKKLKERLKLTAEEWSDKVYSIIKSEDQSDADFKNYKKLSRQMKRNRLINAFPKFNVKSLTAQISEIKNLIKRIRDK